MAELAIKIFDNSVFFIDNFGKWCIEYVQNTPTTTLIIHSTIALFIIVALYVLNLIVYIFTVRMVAGKKMRYSRECAGGSKILIVGDSTAVGTGAERVEETISGRLAKDFPNTDILNLAVNGSLTSDIISQFEKVKDRSFDMIIISTGGNDVWNFTGLSRLSNDLRKVLIRAKEMSGHRVIVLFFGNDGSAPFFPFFIRKFLMRRTAKVQKVFLDITEYENVPLIQLFTTGYDNPFVENPKKYFAKDGLHPSSEGYWVWYKRMWRVMNDNKYLYYEKNQNDQKN